MQPSLEDSITTNNTENDLNAGEWLPWNRQVAHIHVKEILRDSLISWEETQWDQVIIELESCLKEGWEYT